MNKKRTFVLFCWCVKCNTRNALSLISILLWIAFFFCLFENRVHHFTHSSIKRWSTHEERVSFIGLKPRKSNAHASLGTYKRSMGSWGLSSLCVHDRATKISMRLYAYRISKSLVWFVVFNLDTKHAINVYFKSSIHLLSMCTLYHAVCACVHACALVCVCV